MIQLQNLGLVQGDKPLLEEANLTIHQGQRVGIVGPNGCGKSSLLSTLQGQMEPQTGEIVLGKGLRITAMDQETPALDTAASDFVAEGDSAYAAIQQQLTRAEAKEDHEKIVALHNRLADIDGYRIPNRAEKLLQGIGFSGEEMQQPVKSFSGGWRMRLNLARCLMSQSDILLLDEPTNHLDMEAMIWLEGWLANYPGTLLLVSHDRDFIDGVVTHIMHFHRHKLKMYTGNYSSFEDQWSQELALQQATHEKQQTQISHMMDFVNRFRAKATKAKQAQSRLKSIEKMQLVAAVQKNMQFTFEFPEPDKLPNPLISMDDVKIGYDKPVLEFEALTITSDARIGLLGPNGAGKSSFIKTIAGELPLLSGICKPSANTKVGYFAQHQVDALAGDLTVIQTLQEVSSGASEGALRKYLGGFAFSKNMAFAKVSRLSGGEKARLALACIIWQAPNLLLLDEPTNHLDFDMRQALNLALQNYQGGLIVVSHDRYLLRTTVNEFLLVAEGTIKPFPGTLEAYQAIAADMAAQQQNRNVQKDKHQLKEEKPRHRNLQRELDKCEKRMEKLQQALHNISHELADNDLYQDPAAKDYLEKLIAKQKNLQKKLTECEAEWLALQE